MKRAQRAVYLELTKEIDWQLCSFCIFAESNGCGAGLECTHPLLERLPVADCELYPGEDCWGFRPSLSVSLVADIIGIILEQGWEEASWWEDEGVLKVAGRA